MIWVGNNEVETGWQSWSHRQAFQKSITAQQRERIEQGMHTLFDVTLRDVVARYAPEVPYQPTSPGTSSATGPVNVLDQGDYHYWNVWSGKALPANAYRATWCSATRRKASTCRHRRSTRSLRRRVPGYTLTLASDKLAREVWISFGGLDAKLSDNAFDPLPGGKVTVRIQSRASLADLQRALQVQVLAAALRGPAP